VRERMAKIKGQRRQHGVNYFPKMIIHLFLLRLAEFVIFQKMNAVFIKMGPDFLLK